MRKLLDLLLVVCGVPAFAQVPSGQFTYAFTNTPLWDLSGSYTNGTGTNDTIIVIIQQQVNGQIIGARSEFGDTGTYSFDGSGTISGRMFSKPSTVGIRASWKGSYTVVYLGVSHLAISTGQGTSIIVPSSLTLLDTGGGFNRLCFAGGKCVPVTGQDAFPLLANMTGDWTLDTDIAATRNRLTGTGTITLSNGRELSYQITGSYNAKSQSAKLRLVGNGDALGTSLSLTTQGPGANLISLKGSVLGQKLTFP